MPPPVLVGTVRAATALVDDFGPFGQDLIDEFWPGGLTLVARSSPTLAWDLGETRGTVAVRMPLHAAALDLLKRTGPMAVSSANITGNPAATTADEAVEQLGDSIAVYLDGGPCGGACRVHDRRPDRLGAPPAPRRRHRHGPPPRGRDPGHRRGSRPPAPTTPPASPMTPFPMMQPRRRRPRRALPMPASPPGQPVRLAGRRASRRPRVRGQLGRPDRRRRARDPGRSQPTSQPRRRKLPPGS